MRTLRNFVNGEYVDTASGETTSLINPSTGEEFARGAAIPGRGRRQSVRSRVEGVQVVGRDDAL